MLKIYLQLIKGLIQLNNGSFVIADWLVKPDSNLLINNDIERKIEPKVMQLLVFLANANGEVVSRDKLLSSVWEQIVQDDALTNTIAHLRKALDDTSSPKRYIQTIPKQGYRLIPEVIWEKSNNPSDERQATTTSNTNFHKSNTYQVTEKNVTKTKSLVGLLIAFAVIFLAIKFLLPQPTETVTVSQRQSGSVAVLPFDVYSSQAEVSFFSSGLTEELIHQLAADPKLKVSARTSSSQFKGTNKSIREIAEILGVKYVIEGSVRENGDSIKVTVQLIEAQQGFHLWSKTFESNATETLVKAQESISKQVSALITKGQPDVKIYKQRKHPDSDQAYRLFLLAQAHMKKAQVEDYEKALVYYQQAIDIAPDYALAYTGMAAANVLLYQYKHTSLEQTNILASTLLAKALEIEPNLAEAFAVKGLLNIYLQAFKQSEQDFLKAIALNPGSRFARHNYGYLLWRQSRSSEALVQFNAALEMDPLSPLTNFSVGDTLGNLGETEKAITHFKTCQKLLPNYFGCYLGLASIYNLTGELENQKESLLLSQSRIQNNNFWQTTSQAAYEFQVGNYDTAQILVTKASLQNKANYFNLKTDFNLNIHASTLDLFSQKLGTLTIETPNNLELNLLLGLASYFEEKCLLSVAQYEKASNGNKQSLLVIRDFSEGISHALNLAHCYKQRNNMMAYEKTLDAYQNFLQNMPKTKFQIPGKIYNQARFLALKGKVDEAKLELEKIKDWSFIGLAKKDPILKSLFDLKT